MIVKLIRPALLRGEVMWAGTILDMPTQDALVLINDRIALPIPEAPESPEAHLETGEHRGS